MMRALAMTLCGLSVLAFAEGEKPNPYLAQARVFYQGGEFKKCLDRVKQAERWDSSIKELAEVSLYAGLCHFNVRKQKDAELDFLRAVQTDPSLELPAATSPKIVEVWNRVRAKVPRPESPPEPPLVPTAKEPEPEPIATATPTQRPLAAIPLELETPEEPQQQTSVAPSSWVASPWPRSQWASPSGCSRTRPTPRPSRRRFNPTRSRCTALPRRGRRLRT